MNLALGYYVNLFEVDVPKENISIFKIERTCYPSLRDLKNEVKGSNIYLYAPERSAFIYGFGKDMELLSRKGFEKGIINLHSEPRLTSYIVLQGIFNKAENSGYIIDQTKGKGRYLLCSHDQFQETSNKQVKVFKCYDIRVIFLKPESVSSLQYGIIIDVSYKFKNRQNNPLNFRDIVQIFGSSVLKEVRQIQKDLVPTGINTEVSKQRLLEDILPFVEEISEIVLPVKEKIIAHIDSNPTQVIIGEGD